MRPARYAAEQDIPARGGGALPRAGWLLLGLVVLPACTGGVLSPHGPVGRAEKTILIDSLAIMLAIAIPTILATAAFAWWYRASNGRARYLPDWDSSGRIELVVWFIPAMVVILLAGVTWLGSHQLDPARPLAQQRALEVQVVSLDWKWLFIYPDFGVASVNELAVPAGTAVHFSLTSASVMNSFFVPELGSMIYTMNGMVTQLNLKADAPGTFRGISSHYSGEGFPDMHFQMQALTDARFAAWITAARASTSTLDASAYAALSQQGTSAHLSFRNVEPHLFERIAARALPAGPGPSTEHAGAAQAPAGVR